MNSLPWQKVPLGNICDIVAGGTPSRKNSKYFGGDIPWVKISDMLQGTITFTDETITKEGLENSAAKILPAGTLLISIFATIGRTAILGLDAATNQAIVGVLPKKDVKVNQKFLRYSLDNSILELTKEARGVAQININGKILKSLEIPLPPLPEQGRIVRLLDEAEALRTQRTQANKRMEDFVPALFEEMFGKKEMGWSKVAFHEIAQIDAPMVDPRKTEFLDLIHIGPEHIEKETGKLLPARTAREDGLISGKYLFDETHVLYSKIRPYLKKAALPTFKGLCSADMYPIKPDTSMINREFLWATILSEEFSEYAISVSRRANMPKINREQLFSYELIIPPLALQQEFAERVKEAREIQSAQGRSTERVEALYQSMLDRAFKGEL